MKNTKTLWGAALTVLLTLGSITGCNKNSAGDKYDKQGRLILNLKNVYFDTWDGSDDYTEMINEKFQVNVKASNYDYDGWDEMVNVAIRGNNITDVIHFNLKAYNFGTTYEEWADQLIIKALPDDMSPWPNLQAMLSKVSNIDALKIDGKLYGIPIMNDIKNTEKDFSNFTYVYRRDQAKAIDEAHKDDPGWENVYKEGDVYTWEEFVRLVKAFKTNPPDGIETYSPIVDEEWGFPSVTNFYKDAPHCYTKNSSGEAINTFTSDGYVAGLEVAREFTSKNYYSNDQYLYTPGKANELYLGDQASILYDNYSLANYLKLRKAFKKNHKTENLDDCTALLKIKGPDGNFALEGTENWFSMTMFNYDISEKKMNKILDIMDYLLSEEGTRLAIYGKEGYDYNIVDGKVVLTEQGWEKDDSGNYINKVNGAKYLRYMVTLGNDTKSYDPYTEMDAYNILNAWQEEMKQAKSQNKLRVVKEPADISWMSTPTKNDKTQALLSDANVYAAKYAAGKYASIDAYKAEFEKDIFWKRVLDEINEELAKK